MSFGEGGGGFDDEVHSETTYSWCWDFFVFYFVTTSLFLHDYTNREQKRVETLKITVF